MRSVNRQKIPFSPFTSRLGRSNFAQTIPPATKGLHKFSSSKPNLHLRSYSKYVKKNVMCKRKIFVPFSCKQAVCNLRKEPSWT